MKIRLAVAAAAALTGVLAPPATAAGIVFDRACYREGESASFLGTGFQPGQPVAVSIDGRQIGTTPADAVGNVGGRILSLPGIPRSEQKRALSMSQISNPALNATKAFTETKLYVVTKPGRFTPGNRLRIRAGGFYGAGKSLYAHVRGPTKRNLRIGAVKGDCGKVSATKKVLLKRGDKPGFYIAQFDTDRKFRGLKTVLQFRRAYTIRILRFSRQSSLSAPVLGTSAEWVPNG